MNGLGFYLLVYGEPRHAVLVGNSAALMGRRDTELAQKAILVLWMQFSFLRFKLKEEPLTYTGIATQFWKAVFSKKLLSSTVTDMHFFQVVGVCHVVYCDDKKKKNAVLNMSWKTCLRRYTYPIAFLLLSVTEFIQQSSILALITWPKHKKPQWMHQLYIFSNFRDICLITDNNCSRKVLIAKIWGLMPLNTSFMTKLGLKVVIIAIYSIKLKICQFICNAQIRTHVPVYLNQYTARYPWHSMAASWQLRKKAT